MMKNKHQTYYLLLRKNHLQKDKESDEMHNNYHNNENRNRPQKENIEEEDGNDDEEVDIYNDRTLRDREKVDYHRLHNYDRTQMINISKQPPTSNMGTFSKVIGIAFDTLGRMKMSNKQLPIKKRSLSVEKKQLLNL